MSFINCFRRTLIILSLLFPLTGIAQKVIPKESNGNYKLIGTFNQYLGEILACDDFKLGMAAAKNSTKSALLYFNAYGSINARRFDENVLADSGVNALINSRYQLTVLFVDDTTRLDETETFYSEELKRLLKTKGDYNMHLQLKIFKDSRQPMFFIVDPSGEIIDSTLFIDRKNFYNFLKQDSKAFED